MRSQESGFSLLEIMVVLVIMGMLAAIVAPNVMNAADEAKVDTTRSQIKNLEQTLKMYKLNEHQYPSSSDGLKALLSGGKKGKKYMDHLPKDGWGNDFIYVFPGVHGDFDLLSYGADAQNGGSDFDADIGNWE
ncbi:MAG: type II secretion system major pseudopilin GspG [Mariprofundaceae bacterium]|nr:type II secretion system major pseudopilin GspG [Mariprofundaceae bacterium]